MDACRNFQRFTYLENLAVIFSHMEFFLTVSQVSEAAYEQWRLLGFCDTHMHRKRFLRFFF